MPLEAVEDRPEYSEKIDCFSFGVVTVQILAKQFPKPRERQKEIQINNPKVSTILLRYISEIEHRQNHLSKD